jgi:hypothetical protein
MWGVLLVAVTVAFIFGHWSSLRRAKSAWIKAGPDATDVEGLTAVEAKSCFDPYFNHVNYFGTIVLSGTNANLAAPSHSN